MKLFASLTILAGVLVAGCTSNNSNFSAVPGPSGGGAIPVANEAQPAPTPSQPPRMMSTPPKQSPSTAPAQAVVTPDNSPSGKVMTYNAVGRFVVLRFASGETPKTGQTFFAYRGGLKVGELKISGEQRDDFIVADVVSGEAQPGDDVRNQ